MKKYYRCYIVSNTHEINYIEYELVNETNRFLEVTTSDSRTSFMMLKTQIFSNKGEAMQDLLKQLKQNKQNFIDSLAHTERFITLLQEKLAQEY